VAHDLGTKIINMISLSKFLYVIDMTSLINCASNSDEHNLTLGKRYMFHNFFIFLGTEDYNVTISISGQNRRKWITDEDTARMDKHTWLNRRMNNFVIRAFLFCVSPRHAAQ
jgi:hypothetical protein